MSWTDPKTWAIGEALTAALLNVHLKDNLNALKDPPSDNHEMNQTADLTTASTSYVDVDLNGDSGTEFSMTLTTTGGDVMIGFVGSLLNSTLNSRNYLDVYESVGGARLGGDDGMVMVHMAVAAKMVNMSFVWLATGLAAGAHTFTLQWKVSAGTATLYAGAGTANFDLHPQFWAREVS